MAVQHEFMGPALVKYQSTPVSLGYTRDGAQVRIEPKFIDVPSDDFGGQSGAPADAQSVGGIAQVTCELTKWDKSECYKLTAFVAAGTAFTFPAYGTLIRQSTKYAPLVLVGANETLTFPQAFPRQACEMNKGARFTSFMCGFEAWVDAAATRVLATTGSGA